MLRSNPILQRRILTLKNRLTTTQPIRWFSNTLSSLDESKKSPPSLPFRPRRRPPKPLSTPPTPKTSRYINPPYRPLAPSSILATFKEDAQDAKDDDDAPPIDIHQRLHEKSLLSDDPNDQLLVHPTDRRNDYKPKDYQQRSVSFSRAPATVQYLRQRRDSVLHHHHDDSHDDNNNGTLDYTRLSAHNSTHDAETILRLADYVSSPDGSTEDNVLTRRVRSLSHGPQAMEELQRLLTKQAKYTWQEDYLGFDRPTPAQLGLQPEFPNLYHHHSNHNHNHTQNHNQHIDPQPNDNYDPNQKAYGPWSESIISVDRVQKVTRGGTTVRYRALAIGGNLNGCGGYGVAKANTPPEAVALACARTRRNIVFVDRYKNSGLTEDLVGKHNSCKVLIRATGVGRGLKGTPLACEILKYMGITDCTVKTHGNRNKYSVVYGVFKALLTHEGLEDIALKRGKRLLNLERARRLQV